MLYGNWIAGVVDRFQREFDSIVVGNNLEYGAEFEIAVARGLKKVLPARCGVCRGYVVEKTGKKAGDDIIIYDRSRFQTLHALGDDLGRKDHVPFEAVLAYIEAKHTLRVDDDDHRQSLYYACTQVANVRALHRKFVRPLPGAVTKGFTSPGFPKIENELYTAIIARHVEPAASKPVDLSDAMRRVRDSGIVLPDLVVAGRLLSVPACYGFMDGKARLLGTRPFLNVEGNRPMFLDSAEALGTGLVHMMSAIEDINLGQLPWFEMIHDSLYKREIEVTLWGPDESFKKAEEPTDEPTTPEPKTDDE